MRRALANPIALVAAIVATLLVTQPVLAETPLGTTGTVGSHSLNDTSTSNPGATCGYRYDSTDDVWLINKITVRAPNMKAVAGSCAQKVGGSYIVQRRIYGPVGRPGPWLLRYTSPTFTKVTSDKTNAALTAKSVPVRVSFGVGAGYEYRVIVTMVWYRASGGVQGTAKSRVDYYTESFGSTSTSSKGHCSWMN
jgi:hypothetical protein